MLYFINDQVGGWKTAGRKYKKKEEKNESGPQPFPTVNSHQFFFLAFLSFKYEVIRAPRLDLSHTETVAKKQEKQQNLPFIFFSSSSSSFPFVHAKLKMISSRQDN